MFLHNYFILYSHFHIAFLFQVLAFQSCKIDDYSFEMYLNIDMLDVLCLLPINKPAKKPAKRLSKTQETLVGKSSGSKAARESQAPQLAKSSRSPLSKKGSKDAWIQILIEQVNWMSTHLEETLTN